MLRNVLAVLIIGLAQLAETLPVATVGDALAGSSTCGVLFDNLAGVRLALEHLHSLGHRRVTVLTSTSESTPDRARSTN